MACSTQEMNIVFLGNHDVGIESLSEIIKNNVNVSGVIAHPFNEEEGVVYSSLYDYAQSKEIDTIRGNPNNNVVKDFIIRKKPDLLWVVDYKYILPKDILKLLKLGAINLHPSLLPAYRGRAPLNWAIINGEKEYGLTAHYIDEKVDEGDIITQKKYHLSDQEDVKDALLKLYPLYREITKEVLYMLKENKVNLKKQQNKKSPVYPKRTPDDGLIDWNNPAKDVFNLIRAVAKPYPGAFTYFNNKKVIIWKSLLDMKHGEKPGQVIDFKNGCPIISCGEQSIVLKDYIVCCGSNITLNIGDSFS